MIAGHYYLIDIKQFRDLPMSLWIKGKVPAAQEFSRIRRFCAEHPRISWVTLYCGAYPLEVVIHASSYEEASTVVRQFTAEFPTNVASTKLVPQLGFSKFTMYPFAEPPTRK